MFYEQRCSYKLHKIHRKTPVPESFFNKTAGLRAATLLLFFFYSGTGAFLWILRNVYRHVISKPFWTTASDFICSVFFIFSIIKHFRHEKARFVRKTSTSRKPVLGFAFLRANEYFRTETVKLPKKIQPKCLIFSHDHKAGQGDHWTSDKVLHV